MIDWRAFFDDHDIEWIDRGKNCGRNRVNIACPFCGDDPSFHMSIDETDERYYCFREPNAHSGRRFSTLLVALGIDYKDIPIVLHNYDAELELTVIQKRSALLSEDKWEEFKPAADSNACCNYLRKRGFDTPVAVCRQYDLRYAPVGIWAQRLLIPIREEGRVITWTGRALRADMELRYLTEPVDVEHFLYLPRAPRPILVIVEGPMDALKIAVATNEQPICSAALLGKAYFAKVDKIAALAEGRKEIRICFDADVSFATLKSFARELEGRVTCPVKIFHLPYGFKDGAEMDAVEIRDWLAPSHQ